jgi:hypothetical protein
MEKIKEFVSEHKTAVALAGASLGLAGGYYYIRSYNN